MGKTYFRFFNKNAILSIHVFVQGESVIIKKNIEPSRRQDMFEVSKH